jgi:hypothetical protein
MPAFWATTLGAGVSCATVGGISSYAAGNTPGQVARDTAMSGLIGAATNVVFYGGIMAIGKGISLARNLALEATQTEIAAMDARAGVTMLGSSPNRLAASQYKIDQLYADLLETANSPKFISRAQSLGFSEEQISTVPGKIAEYYKNGQLGFINSGGWMDETNLLVGQNAGAGTMRHELGHVLDEIANPGLSSQAAQNPATFGYWGFYDAEMTAYGIQLGVYNPIRPYMAGLTAAHNRFGWPGSIIYVGITSYIGYKIESEIFHIKGL